MGQMLLQIILYTCKAKHSKHITMLAVPCITVFYCSWHCDYHALSTGPQLVRYNTVVYGKLHRPEV